MILKMNKSGRWASEPWEPQVEAITGQEFFIDGSIVIENGVVTTVTQKFADMIKDAGHGEILNPGPVSKNEKAGPVKKAEGKTSKKAESKRRSKN
jgi:hypothetical protein